MQSKFHSDSTAPARFKIQKGAILPEGSVRHCKGASKNADFAQMQGAEKISQRRIWMICKQENEVSEKAYL
jgi:hypothetical protein